MNFFDLLFDRRCSICSKSIDKGAVCFDCERALAQHVAFGRRSLVVDDRKFDVAYIFDYDAPVVKTLLGKLKHSSNSDLFEYAACLYEKLVSKEFSGVVTCCPRRKSNVRLYGYDQVAQPCKIMCKNSGGRLKFMKLIKRRGISREQKKLTAVQRAENTKGKFVIKTKDIPKNILIVDDVITTGNTVKSCVREIYKRRADANVQVICLASRGNFPVERQFE